jgi:release factor glutamine methyltransferase
MPELADRLAAAGFVSAREEAGELRARARGDERLLAELVERRLAGEPLAWIVGGVSFCGLEVRVDPGVYVPRPHTGQLARRAAERLPADGTAVDICTGSGAVAAVLRDRRPGSTVVATDVDERAVACARANGVDAPRRRPLRAAAPGVSRPRRRRHRRRPYVPTPALTSLQRDTFAFESPLAYDGGPDGTTILRRAVADSRIFLLPGGALLLELGGGQADLLAGDLARLGFVRVSVLAGEDGDTRGIEATLAG